MVPIARSRGIFCHKNVRLVVMRITEAARRLDMTPRMLRYRESLGLLPPLRNAVRRPAAGRPAAGLPAAGLPAAGLPAAGLPAAGLPAAGRPAAGRLGTG